MPNEKENFRTLTEAEQKVYNKHLIISRAAKNKLFRPRKKFDNFLVDSSKCLHLQRLVTFFDKYPTIDIDSFFAAPYSLYKDVEFFGLDYFASMKALKAYTTWKNMKMSSDPDTQIDDTLRSLKFIAQFCIDNGVHMHQYPRLLSSTDIFVWLVHFKQSKINIYSMMEFDGMMNCLAEVDKDVVTMYVGNLPDLLPSLKINYMKSSKLRTTTHKAFKAFENKVQEVLLTKTKTTT